jgi:hypothetical protein
MTTGAYSRMQRVFIWKQMVNVLEPREIGGYSEGLRG